MNMPTVEQMIDYPAIIKTLQEEVGNLKAEAHSRETELLAIKEKVRAMCGIIRNGGFRDAIALAEALLERMK